MNGRKMRIAIEITAIIGTLVSVPVSAYETGEVVTFGHYEQDNNLDNGPEEIRWLVLSEDEGSVLLISEQVLDRKPYRTTNRELENDSQFSIDVSWEDSYMREWMNGEFYNTAFDSAEMELIEMVNVEANALDKVFVLSPEELELFDYGSAKESVFCEKARAGEIMGEWGEEVFENSLAFTTATDYVIDSWEKEYDREYEMNYYSWWLRGNEGNNIVTYINEEKWMNCAGEGAIPDSNQGMRPSIWVKL